MLVTVKPARLASMPQANPVGPAPITTTSKEDCSAVSGALRSMSLGYREQQRADFHDALPPSVILSEATAGSEVEGPLSSQNLGFPLDSHSDSLRQRTRWFFGPRFCMLLGTPILLWF